MPLWMVYLDLGELDRVFAASRWWSHREFAPVRYERSDYLGDPGEPLDESVRSLVERELGRRPSGPVRLLAHLRQWGYVFNPVSFYYCFAREPGGSERLDAIVAQITNTPWNERHAYVLDCRGGGTGGGSSEGPGEGESHRFAFSKALHVSPFMPMDLGYEWRFSPPGREALGIHMALRRGRSVVFDATLKLTPAPVTADRVRSCVTRYPLLTARVIARIHAEAFKLWLKRVPIHPHPASGGAA